MAQSPQGPRAEAHPQAHPDLHSEGPVGQTQTERTGASVASGEQVTLAAKACYYTLGFLAHWFGAARFDMDGDGDFDAADMQAIINSTGRHLHLSFSRPPQSRASKKKRRKALEAKKRKQEREAAVREKEHQHALAEAGTGVGGAVNALTENVLHSMERGVEKIAYLTAADVEGEEEEAQIVDNLRQYLPWFCIVEILLCLGLWIGYAVQERPYTAIADYTPVLEANVLSTYVQDTTIYLADCRHECNKKGACLGIAFLDGPLPECKLLRALPDASLGASITACGLDSFNWVQYRKEPFDLNTFLATTGGLESQWPGQTALRSHYFCEEGFHLTFLYRWWTYQFTHGGLSHVISNCFMTLMLGIPLEGLHGTGTMAVMWTTGVFGGALNWLLFDPYRLSYGASGGCFSLLGMHIADLVMNWGQKKFRFMLIFMLLLVTGVELAGFWATYDEAGSLTAHCVHVGGLVAGLFIGVCVGRNIHQEAWERRVQIFCWAGGITLSALALAWWFFANPFPGISNLWDPTERPWCWIGQACIGDDGADCPWSVATGASSFEETFSQCVFCETRDCVLGWYSKTITRLGVESYAYCPRSYAWSECHDHFDSSWDLFWPPSKSLFQ